MTYSHRLFDSINDVPLDDWRRACGHSARGFFLQPEFIGVVEASMTATTRFRHIIVYNAEGEPLACATLSLMTLDLAQLMDPMAAAVFRALPNCMSGFRLFKLLMCGLPISLGQKSLALVAGCDAPSVLQAIDTVLVQLARETSAQILAYKEFDGEELDTTHVLLARGYRRFGTPPMNSLECTFGSFEAYCAALNSHYRRVIRLSTRKLERSGGRVRILTQPAEILATYDSGVHSLYLEVVQRAALKLEILPIEFFHELARRFERRVELVVIERNSDVLAFGWALQTECSYDCLFGGVDYGLNRELDLYFNLVYAMLDAGMRKGLPHIHVGQAADTFKARLGCRQQPLYLYARGVGWFTGALLRYGAGFLLPIEPAPSLDVFKSA